MARQRRTPPPDRITPDQQRFIDEYLIDLNATQAYRRAYPGSSYRTANIEGPKLRVKPSIKAEIDAAKKARRQRTHLTADKVVRELARIAFADVFEVYAADGSILPVRMIPPEVRAAVSAVKVRKERTTRRTDRGQDVTVHECEVEYKFWPKVEALSKLCDHLGLAAGELTPLESLLAVLPAPLAGQVRAALAGTLPPGGGTEGTGG